MKRLLAVLAFISFATAAEATVMRMDDGKGQYIRLFDIPCNNDVVLAKTPLAFRPRMQAGEAMIDGKLYGMCWTALPDGTVGMMYEDGDQGRLPVQAFKAEVGA